MLTQLSYSKNNKRFLGKIFKNFAMDVLSEVSENMSKETAKFFIENTIKIEYQNNNLETTLSEIVLKWNTAVSTRDTDSLFNLYGYNVLYYGSELSDNKCIEDKNRFYKRYPYFTQSIENIIYEKISTNLYKISFDKLVKLKKSKGIKHYPSYLVIDTSYSSPLIMVEGDTVTDAILLRKYNK